MNRTFKARLDQLEARHSPIETRAIFFTVVSKETGDPNDGWRVPATGWRYGDTDIMREDGETDEALRQRAFEYIKEQQPDLPGIFMFRQISDRLPIETD